MFCQAQVWEAKLFASNLCEFLLIVYVRKGCRYEVLIGGSGLDHYFSRPEWITWASHLKIADKKIVISDLHCKNYSNVHFKSQNYSCVLDSHTCLGDRISCCRKISGDKSKIKAVILMEIIKTTESRSQIYTGIFLSLSLWQWKKITSTVFSV